MAEDNTIYWVGAAIAGYFIWQHFSTAAAHSAVTQYCKFPDGSYITVPVGNSCPYDPIHGGQSTLCPANTYPSTYKGPLPAQGRFC